MRVDLALTNTDVVVLLIILILMGVGVRIVIGFFRSPAKGKRPELSENHEKKANR